MATQSERAGQNDRAAFENAEGVRMLFINAASPEEAKSLISRADAPRKTFPAESRKGGAGMVGVELPGVAAVCDN
jgi:hypothetical protein